MTTLAELTPEQRKKCVGMWVDTPWGLGVLLGIYDDWGCEGPVVWCHERSQMASARWLLNQVTLRPDLPRAWNSDGTPPINMPATPAETQDAFERAVNRWKTALESMKEHE